MLSTASVPAADRLAYWHEVIERTCVPLDITPIADEPFRGMVTTDRLGCLQISTVEGDANRVRRTARLIAKAEGEHVNLGVQGRNSGVVAQDGREALLGPGDLTFYDTTRPYALRFAEPFRMRLFSVPRQALGLSEPDLQRITAVTLRPDTGTAALVARFLSRLAAEAPSYPPRIGDMLARNAVDLLSTLIAERLGQDTTDTAGTAMRLRIQTFIDRHLSDPDLSPQAIAAEHHVSVRYVHRLFEAEGTTVSRWIQRRRLEACRRELGRPGTGGPSVSAVAHRFGFTSPSHFSRTFRIAYGMSPRQWRAIAGGGCADDQRRTA
ncbi:helix-turn-helix domain-containing protein [Streptomyces sp. NA02950]|uniref:AraC-like ligand-binding domain-containing protein n=1 Tax=Streptomyces sp. NA02950 TaxID=2742137 RepID=UPI0020CAA99F|nr:helix-turn-helix domain-containing protein [Streptomyces sp. NA02950]